MTRFHGVHHKMARSLTVFMLSALAVGSLHAALFEDDEARRAILELRQRVETLRADTDKASQAAVQDSAGVGKSLMDLQRQLELMRADMASMRGANEQLAREVAELQRVQRDQTQALNERMGKLEPVKVAVDGIEFVADPAEKRDFESALTVFRKGDFATAQTYFVAFIGRYPASPYVTSALFWLGNAQYALRDYKDAMVNFRALVAKDAQHMRVPEAVLSLANCQLELKDTKAARKTLADLIKAYPQSEAAVAAKERLATLK